MAKIRTNRLATIGANRAATIIMEGRKYIETGYGRKTVEGLADLIDHKTQAKDMLQVIFDLLACYGTDEDKAKQGYRMVLPSHLLESARAIVAKDK